MSSNDILVEIPNHHLPKLAALFENKAPWAPHMVTFVHIAMKWKENTKYKDKIVFLSPYNCWETDGTIIVIVQVRSTLAILVHFHVLIVIVNARPLRIYFRRSVH